MKHLKKAGRKRCEYNNKAKDNSPNILSDKNDQASSPEILPNNF